MEKSFLLLINNPSYKLNYWVKHFRTQTVLGSVPCLAEREPEVHRIKSVKAKDTELLYLQEFTIFNCLDHSTDNTGFPTKVLCRWKVDVPNNIIKTTREIIYNTTNEMKKFTRFLHNTNNPSSPINLNYISVGIKLKNIVYPTYPDALKAVKSENISVVKNPKQIITGNGKNIIRQESESFAKIAACTQPLDKVKFDFTFPLHASGSQELWNLQINKENIEKILKILTASNHISHLSNQFTFVDLKRLLHQVITAKLRETSHKYLIAECAKQMTNLISEGVVNKNSVKYLGQLLHNDYSKSLCGPSRKDLTHKLLPGTADLRFKRKLRTNVVNASNIEKIFDTKNLIYPQASLEDKQTLHTRNHYNRNRNRVPEPLEKWDENMKVFDMNGILPNLGLYWINNMAEIAQKFGDFKVYTLDHLAEHLTKIGALTSAKNLYLWSNWLIENFAPKKTLTGTTKENHSHRTWNSGIHFNMEEVLSNMKVYNDDAVRRTFKQQPTKRFELINTKPSSIAEKLIYNPTLKNEKVSNSIISEGSITTQPQSLLIPVYPTSEEIYAMRKEKNAQITKQCDLGSTDLNENLEHYNYTCEHDDTEKCAYIPKYWTEVCQWGVKAHNDNLAKPIINVRVSSPLSISKKDLTWE